MQARSTASGIGFTPASRIATALLFTFAGLGSASAATLSVGPGKTYAAPCAAIAAAQDGDIIEIAGGNTYTGDVCGIYRNNLTIRGVNGRPVINANGANAMGKGTWVVESNNVTVENVEMLGAKVPDHNGAALRLEGSGFTLRTSFLHDNENGILSNPNTASDILVEYTEFGHNGYGDGYSHNLYIGNNRSLTFRYNYSHDANQGHNLKSRALTNTIVYNRFSSTAPGATGSTATGSPSYEIDLPNAGTSYVIGNVIEQPAANSNPNMLAYGEEGPTNGGQDLYVVNNTFLNDAGSGIFVMIGSGVTTPALLQNNVFAGAGSITNQASAISKTNYAAATPAFVDRAGYDLHPTSSAMIDAGSAPGTAPSGVPLAPVAQYKPVAYGETRTAVGAVDIGAYEAASGATSAPAPTATWTDCAKEDGTCNFSGTAQVRYGANGLYVTKTLTGPVACNNATFGDPINGVAKSCSYAASGTATAPAPTAPAPAPTPTAPAPTTTWTDCAIEGGTCNFSGTAQVRFGANGLYVTKTLTGPVACTWEVFGDPINGVAKSCSYAASGTATAPAPTAPAPAPTAPTPTTGWTACANEGGTCSFTGTTQVRYGANGTWVTMTMTGPVACNNATFGDPTPGVAKSCSYDASATTAVTWTNCASEDGTCTFSGTRQVRYGANGTYYTKLFTGSTACSNAVFSDPTPGVAKTCSYSSVTQ